MSKRWWALAALCFAELMVMTDNTIVNVALPTMARELDAGISGLQWIVDAYTLVFAGLLLTGGYLGDRFGHRRMLVIGTVGFAAVSVLAALSQNLGQLIAARGGLGVFAALVFPATLALVTTIFPAGKQRAAAVGIWAATAGVAVAIGPVLGGWLLEHFSWPSVFWANLPFAAIALAAVLALISPAHPEDVAPFDVLGVILSIGGLGLLTYSVIEGPHLGWTSPVTLLGLFGAAVILGLFIRRELRVTNPILDVRLFTNRFFAGAAGLISIAFFALFGFIFLITQYFQAVKGYGPLEAGLRTLPFAVVMALFSPVAVLLAHRFGPRLVGVAGALLMSGGFALVQLVERDSGYWSLVIWSMSMMAAGLAFISGPCTQLIMDALTPAQVGAGAAVNDTTREVGGTLGVAVLGSVLTAVYAADVGGRLSALGVPQQITEIAEQSVIAGVDVAAQAPVAVADTLRIAVQDIFVDGLHSAVWVAVAITATGAVIAAIFLRGAPTPAGRDDPADPPEAGLQVESEALADGP